MTEQEIFQIVWNGMENQNWERCVNPIEHECQYIYEEKRCPVGHCMTEDEAILADSVKGRIKNLIRNNVFPVRLMQFKDLLESFQEIHDNYDNRNKEKLKSLFAELNPVLRIVPCPQ
jgi:hypothetical protein